MKITIEPTENQAGRSCPYSTISIAHPHDSVSVEVMMTEVVRCVQAWGFQNTNIAEFLDEDFARNLGLTTEE